MLLPCDRMMHERESSIGTAEVTHQADLVWVAVARSSDATATTLHQKRDDVLLEVRYKHIAYEPRGTYGCQEDLGVCFGQDSKQQPMNSKRTQRRTQPTVLGSQPPSYPTEPNEERSNKGRWGKHQDGRPKAQLSIVHITWGTYEARRTG